MNDSPSEQHDQRSLHVRTWLRLGLQLFPGLLCVTFAITSTHAQSLEKRLDEEQFLRGVVELQLPEVLEQYIQSHPASDSVQQASYAIATARLSLNAVGLSNDQREASLERLLAARRRMMADHPGGTRQPIWLADQASDLWTELLSIDASGVTTLFGLPSDDQRTRSQRVARDMNDLTAKAEQAVTQAILDLESMPALANDAALQRRRRDLTEYQRDRRIPLLRGVAAFLHAELNLTDAGERKRMFAVAADALAPLPDKLQSDAATQARIYLALSKARLGEHEGAEAQFGVVLADAGAQPADIFVARMGHVLNRTAHKGPQAGIESLRSIEGSYPDAQSVFYRVIIADQQFLLRMTLARQAAAPQRQAMTTQAFSPYVDLLSAEFAPPSDDPSTAVSRETIRAIVFARLVNAVRTMPAGVDAGELPPIVAIALADQLSREPGSRSQAMVMLEDALKDARLESSDRASALFVLAKALFEDGQRLFAAQRFVELAENHPSDNHAERSIELGVTIAADLHRQDLMNREARDVLQRGLDVLLKRYVNLPSIDRWRYAAGRLALDESRFDEAMALFEQITPNSAEWLDAHYMQAATARTKAGKAEEASRTKANEAAMAVIDRVQPVLANRLTNGSAGERTAALRYYLASLRVLRAELLLDMEKPQLAIDSLKGIEDDRSLEGEVIGEALKVRINAYQSLKRPEEAIQEIERFIKAAPEQAGGVIVPMLAALTRDVQVLAEDNRDDEALDLARRTVLPVATMLDQWATARIAAGSQNDDGAIAARIADAYRASGDFDLALVWYERALLKQPDVAELLLGLAESLFHLSGEERLAKAMSIYKRLVAAGPQAGRHQYWLSQLRMLQIIDRVNRNVEQIVPRIERLRQQDSELGGERFRRGFDALRNKHAK